MPIRGRLSILLITLFVASAISPSASAQKLPPDPSKLRYTPFKGQTLPQCEAERCLTMDEIVAKSKSHSFESRAKLLDLFQYANEVKVKMGMLLPHVNFWSVLGAVLLDPSLLFQVAGFVLPSNHFNWQESKLMYLSQRYSLIDLIANQVLLGEALYANLHREIVTVEIYNHYFRFLDDLNELIKSKPNNAGLNQGDLAILEALRADMSATALFIQDTVADLIPQLGLKLGLATEESWERMGITLTPLPKLGDIEDRATEDYEELALQKSDLLKSLFFMHAAAGFALKSRYFEWMTPFSMPDRALGFGFPASLAIGKNETNKIQLRQEWARSQLKYDVHGAVGIHNTALQGYKEAVSGQKSVSQLLNYAIRQIYRGGKVDVHQIYEGVILAVVFDRLKSFAQHLYWIMGAKLRRFGKVGKYYADIEESLPAYHKKDRRRFLLKLENRAIRKALKKGTLKISEKDHALVF